MASVYISDLHSIGSELFSDSESFMNDLGDSELDATYGGISTLLCTTITVNVLTTVIVPVISISV